MHEKIQKWYVNEFPTDELGVEINSTITFNDLLLALDSSKEIYSFLGVHDSIVRERVFDELSVRMGVDYDYIYDKWLLGGQLRHA
jgi:hypothetical protein